MGLKNDLERLNKKATNELLKIDKTLVTTEDKLNNIQNTSRENIIQNAIGTATNSYRLVSDMSILNSFNKVCGILETAAYAFLAFKNVKNYNEASRQLDELNQMRIIYENLSTELDDLNDLAVEMCNRIDESTN